DCIIDFTDQPVGTSITLTNTARTPFDFGTPPDSNKDGLIMQFRVKENTSGEDTSTVPEFLSHIKRYKESDACITRDMTIDVGTDRFSRLLFMLNNKEFMGGVTEDPVVGELECWRIINTGLGVHPIHIHQIQFQILDRIPIDTAAFNQTGQLRLIGEPEYPPPELSGWKDTVQAFPGSMTRILVRFGPYTGRYVLHCHILEHEDHDMMRPFDVVEKRCKSFYCHDCKYNNEKNSYNHQEFSSGNSDKKGKCYDDQYFYWHICTFEDEDPKYDMKDCGYD
ncbi:MAG: multicopper oxidase domain-containing protein, partial [Acetivibrionales bacterium]